MSIEQQLEDISKLYRHLSSLNVVDVSFVSGHSLEVYVAFEHAQRVQGLSDLSGIETDGMMFWFEVPTYVPFSMKAMKFDLDIGWYDVDGKLIQHGTFLAGTEKPLTSPGSFSYVLEVPSGTLPVSDLRING